MIKIRSLSFWDRKKIKKMISFLADDEAEKFTNNLMKDSFEIFHKVLPLKLKFLPESFILLEDNQILGFITLRPTIGYAQKLFITNLMFDKNYYEVGKKLVNYVVMNYGAKGAETFIVAIDESHDELLDLFTNGCGFRFCSSERLWKLPVHEIDTNEIDNSCIKSFKNSQAKTLAQIYNDAVIPHFKPSMLKNEYQFSETIFKGLSPIYKLSYVIEAKNRLIGMFIIKTYDNQNYIINSCSTEGYNIDYENIFKFSKKEISKRQKDFNLFVQTNKYLKNANSLEEFLSSRNCTLIQTKQVLVKDFFKQQKVEASNRFNIMFFNNENNKICW